jgi:hypothetical protein
MSITAYWFVNMGIAVLLSIALAWIMGFLNHKKMLFKTE